MSAKFYCATRAKDPLCGNHREAWFERASASKMARYWGNYGFNNLLLADAFRGKVARGARPGPDRPPPEEKVWQRYRRELQGGDDPLREEHKRFVAHHCDIEAELVQLQVQVVPDRPQHVLLRVRNPRRR